MMIKQKSPDFFLGFSFTQINMGIRLESKKYGFLYKHVPHLT